MTDVLREVQAAVARLAPWVRRTPVRRSRYLSGVSGCEVFLKLENEQLTGSFKVRGAFNKLLPLQGTDQHIVAASTGNHALGVAHACTTLGLACTLYMPLSTKQYKVAALRKYAAQLRFLPGDGLEAEYEARRAACAPRHVFVSPYNDWAVIGGQGTVGTELLAQVPDLDYVFVAVGGGGLISGIASAFRVHSPRTRVVGCSPAASPVMHESVRAGRIVTFPSAPTLSDGTAGGIEAGAVTFSLCRDLVDEWLTVSEDEIARAMQALYSRESLVVEGAAGVATAAFLRRAPRLEGLRIAIVLCGGNVRRAPS